MIKLPDNDSNKKTKSSGIRKPYRTSLDLLKLSFLDTTESTSINLGGCKGNAVYTASTTVP